MDNAYMYNTLDSTHDESEEQNDNADGGALAAAALELIEGQAAKGAIKSVGEIVDLNIEFTQKKNAEKNKLVTDAADDIVKSIKDGTLSKEAKQKIEDAIEKANYLGNEQAVVKAINAKLKASGSNFQISLEHPRQPDDEMRHVGSHWRDDRKVTITDTSKNQVAHAYEFSVYVSGTGMPPPSLIHLALTKQRK